jgi:hypothetical protein
MSLSSGAMPDVLAVGTSTHGVRTPPSASPFASRTSCGGSASVRAIGGAAGAGSPARTQVFSFAMAACRT